jgi:hypothetical protein
MLILSPSNSALLSYSLTLYKIAVPIIAPVLSFAQLMPNDMALSLSIFLKHVSRISL